MSQRRRGRSKASQSTQRSNEDEDEEVPKTQASQQQKLSTEEENQLVSGVVRYLLAVNRSKHAVQRQHLIKNVFGNNAKHYRTIMKSVKDTLIQVFGLKLKEFETGKFILTNNIPNDTPHLLYPEYDEPYRILLILVLSHIFMSDNICKEESLWDFLRKLTIITEDHFKNQYFGDVHKIITVEFVKQHYLDMLKIGSSDPPTYEFKWGVRAEEEVSKRHVLEFVSKMYGDRPINTWPKQFAEVQASERATAEEDQMIE